VPAPWRTLTLDKRTEIALVPILRSGSAILDTMLDLFPAASVYHLGLYRDKHTLLPTGGVATCAYNGAQCWYRVLLEATFRGSERLR
jgi:uracil phosphoribosyltransferase